MIDALIARRGRRNEKPFDPNYKPEDAIVGKELLNARSDRLAVIFPGWHTHAFPVNVLAKRLAKKGWAVLFYDFHDQILEPNEDMVVESLRYIRDKISAEVQELVSERKYKQVHFISLSLGGVPLALVCDKYSGFTSATAVVGGDNLAINMWYGMRTEHYRRAFEKMHVGVRRLAHEWDILAPENHLRHFKGKPVKIVMSLHDNFVRTKYQLKLAQDLRRAGAELSIKRRFTGHALTIVRFCLFDSPL